MFRGYRRYVSLALCLCCTLSMLYLNTLEAKAYSSGEVSVQQSYTVTLYPDNFVVSDSNLSYAEAGTTVGSFTFRESGSGSNSTIGFNYSDSGSGSVNETSTGRATGAITGFKGTYYYKTHVHANFNVRDEKLKVSNFDSSTKYFQIANWGLVSSVDKGSLINNELTINDSLFSNFIYLNKSQYTITGSGTNYISPTITFDGDYSYALYDNTTSFNEPLTFTITLEFQLVEADVSESQVSSSGNPVTDYGANAKLDSISESSSSTAQSSQTTASNTGSILSKITSFFNSFFNNFKNALISVFVPEDGYFSNWFNRLNTLLADKLGVLYYPFDLIISFLTDLQSQSSQSGQIVFPEVALPMNGERHVIIARTVLNLGDYDVSFNSSDNSSLVGSTGYTSVVSTIRTFSSFAICLALVFLFIKKLNHIINGEAS